MLIEITLARHTRYFITLSPEERLLKLLQKKRRRKKTKLPSVIFSDKTILAWSAPYRAERIV